MKRDNSRHHVSFKILGNNIRRIRLSKNISQEELAFRVSSSRNYIGCIERAEKYPSLAVIMDISEALDTNLVDIFKQT